MNLITVHLLSESLLILLLKFIILTFQGLFLLLCSCCICDAIIVRLLLSILTRSQVTTYVRPLEFSSGSRVRDHSLGRVARPICAPPTLLFIIHHELLFYFSQLSVGCVETLLRGVGLLYLLIIASSIKSALLFKWLHFSQSLNFIAETFLRYTPYNTLW